ncbi:Alpha/beta hydrolase fold-1 [Xylariaceae sp. FL0255]|nr:Alpha/beta hydrolase fold-1 [Xylariaceae sp. FL0255]
MTKPYIVLVPGSFALPEAYMSVVEGIKAKGLNIKVRHLPTIGLGPQKGRDTPPASMYDDAALIAKEVAAIADTGREVIVVAHSYGGIPTTESAKGLTVKEREEEGKKGGLVRIGYMTCVVGRVGECCASILGSSPADQPPRVLLNEQGYLVMVDLEHTVRNVFSDIPYDQARQLADIFSPHSARSLGDTITYAGYKEVPVSFLLCEDDQTVSPETQKRGIAIIEEESQNKVDVTSIKSGHGPNASNPDKVVDWIVGMTEK